MISKLRKLANARGIKFVVDRLPSGDYYIKAKNHREIKTLECLADMVGLKRYATFSVPGDFHTYFVFPAREEETR